MSLRLCKKDLEEFCLYRLEKEAERGVADGGRYGVVAVPVGLDERGRPRWQPIPSLPDFEGNLRGGRQFIFDCKVCSQASFPLSDDHFPERQRKHLLRRARLGAVTFLLIHFNARELKRVHDHSVTYAFPTHPDMEFWKLFEIGGVKSISRDVCDQYAEVVEWTVFQGCRKSSPDLVGAIRKLAHRFEVEPLENVA